MPADPKPMMLWNRDRGQAVEEWMPDHQTTYETKPRWRPSDDILAHTPQGMETIVRLGEPIATRLSPRE